MSRRGYCITKVTLVAPSQVYNKTKNEKRIYKGLKGVTRSTLV